VPTPTNDTVPPETVQIPALDAAAEKTTGRPELDVAPIEYEAPIVALEGAVEVKLIDWTLNDGVPLPTENDCCTCGAPW